MTEENNAYSTAPNTDPQATTPVSPEAISQAGRTGTRPLPSIGTDAQQAASSLGQGRPSYQYQPMNAAPTPVAGQYPMGAQYQGQPFGAQAQAFGPQSYGSNGQTRNVSTGTPVAQAQAKPAKQKSGAGKSFAAGFAGAALACVLGIGGFAGYQAIAGTGAVEAQKEAPAITETAQQDDSDASATATTSITVSGGDIELAEAVAEKCLPSIVSIDIYQDVSDMYSAYGYGWGYAPEAGSDSSLVNTSLGSGVVLTADGYIITNYHVVQDAAAIKATVNGVEYDAEYIGADPSSDIAVIKVDASGLTPIEVGSSSDLRVGEWVMSLGSPFGLENSVSSGIVSALQRSTTMVDEATGETVIYPNMIQTDATINPGNSGGALVDAEGKLIGINSIITSYSGSSSGVGFAIPIDYAMSLADQIMDGKTPTHAQLGVSLAAMSEQMVEYYGLATDEGVYVAEVYEGTAAAEAGIQQGDVVTMFDGQKMTTPEELTLAVRSKAVGDTVDVVVNRNGEELTLPVTLGSDETALTSNNEDGRGNGYGYGYGGEGDGYGFDEDGGNGGNGGNGYGYGGGLGDLFGYLF